MKAIVVDTGIEVEVERGEPMENPMGWHSQMWLTDKEGNIYHEDELVIEDYENIKKTKISRI